MNTRKMNKFAVLSRPFHLDKGNVYLRFFNKIHSYVPDLPI